MSITQAVTTIFKAKDQTSKKFDQMGRRAEKFGEKSSKAFRKASKSATSFGKITKGILAAGVISKGLGFLTQGIRAAGAGFLDFDQAITSASAKFSGLDLTTEAGQKTLEKLRKTARQVGKDTEFGADQAAAGLDFLALAGFNAEQAMSLIPGVVNLATVANVDLATATDIASDSLGAFGLMTKDSAQLAKNFTRVQDVMAKTTATSNTNLTDLFEAVKKGAPDFTAAGQSIETFSTLIAAMANAGIKGAEAGTKLRNIAVRLTGGSKEAAAAIENLGIRVADGSGNFRDMLDIIDDVIKGTSKMGEVQKSATLKTIFGARQTGGLNVILKTGTKQLRSYRDMLIDSKGAAEKMAKIMRSSLTNRLKSLGSALLDVGFQFFSAFAGQGAGAIDNLTKIVRNIDMQPFIDGIKEVIPAVLSMWRVAKPIFGAMSAVLIPLADAAVKLAVALGKIADVLPSLPSILGLSEFQNLTPEILKQRREDGIAEANKIVKLQKAAGTFGIKEKELSRSDNPIFNGIASSLRLIEKLAGFETATKKAEKEDSKNVIFDFISSLKAKGPEELAALREAPNKAEVEARQTVDFNGKMTFENAPKGATFESTTTGGQIDTDGLGNN